MYLPMKWRGCERVIYFICPILEGYLTTVNFAMDTPCHSTGLYSPRAKLSLREQTNVIRPGILTKMTRVS